MRNLIANTADLARAAVEEIVLHLSRSAGVADSRRTDHLSARTAARRSVSVVKS